jgi:hypothetical protein
LFISLLRSSNACVMFLSVSLCFCCNRFSIPPIPVRMAFCQIDLDLYTSVSTWKKQTWDDWCGAFVTGWSQLFLAIVLLSAEAN